MILFGKDRPQDVKDIYNVCSVMRGYDYYVHMLAEKCYGMFDFDGTPDSLPGEEIERRLILYGYAIIFNHPKYGLVTSPGGLYGEDKYYLPTYATYSQVALGSGDLKIGVNCVVIYNSQIDMRERRGLSDLIARYARMLADCDSSIANMMINSRQQKMGSAATPAAAKALDEALTKIYAGAPATINVNTLLDLVKTIDWADTTRSGDNIDKLLTSKQKIYSDFLQEIGVKAAFEKRERLLTDEVRADDQLLTINTADMLKYRKIGVELVNDMFGTDITVSHNAAYYYKGGTPNDVE